MLDGCEMKTMKHVGYEIDGGESTLCGGQDCYHIVLFFWGPMFELQPCQYHEGFSQCFYILW